MCGRSNYSKRHYFSLIPFCQNLRTVFQGVPLTAGLYLWWPAFSCAQNSLAWLHLCAVFPLPQKRMIHWLNSSVRMHTLLTHCAKNGMALLMKGRLFTSWTLKTCSLVMEQNTQRKAHACLAAFATISGQRQCQSWNVTGKPVNRLDCPKLKTSVSKN